MFQITLLKYFFLSQTLVQSVCSLRIGGRTFYTFKNFQKNTTEIDRSSHTKYFICIKIFFFLCNVQFLEHLYSKFLISGNVTQQIFFFITKVQFGCKNAESYRLISISSKRSFCLQILGALTKKHVESSINFFVS
jgi:hypothetical protein